MAALSNETSSGIGISDETGTVDELGEGARSRQPDVVPVLTEVVASPQAVEARATAAHAFQRDTSPGLETGGPGAELRHHPGRLMPHDERERHGALPSPVQVVVDQELRAAHAGPDHLDQGFARLRDGNGRLADDHVPHAGRGLDERLHGQSLMPAPVGREELGDVPVAGPRHGQIAARPDLEHAGGVEAQRTLCRDARQLVGILDQPAPGCRGPSPGAGSRGCTACRRAS